jgi:ribosome-interacting GTPase 1
MHDGGSMSYLIDRIWEELGLVRVYTKKRGAHPDLDDPVCLRKGATIEVRTGAPSSHRQTRLLMTNLLQPVERV